MTETLRYRYWTTPTRFFDKAFESEDERDDFQRAYMDEHPADGFFGVERLDPPDPVEPAERAAPDPAGKTVEEVAAELKQLAADHPGWINPMSGADACLYWGQAGDGETHGCIVGQWMHEALGVDTATLEDLPVAVAGEVFDEFLPLDLRDDVVSLLARVQDAADVAAGRGLPWGTVDIDEVIARCAAEAEVER